MNPIRSTVKKLLLGQVSKVILARLFGEKWRAPFVQYIGFGPEVGAMERDTVVLCGCYLIETIRNYLQVVGENGRIVAIEANPNNVKKLEREVKKDSKLRTAENIHIISKGIWDKKGTVTFIANSGDYPGLDKIESKKIRDFSYSKVTNTEQIEIDVDSLDNILKEIGVQIVDYVVFTINDAELLALDGIDQMLRNNPNVRFKLHSESPRPYKEVTEKLRDKGFELVSCPVANGASLNRIYAYRNARAR